MSDKTRIIELQRQLKIARQAFEKIKCNGSHRAPEIADEALYEMMPLDPKRPLQGLCGHEPRRSP